MPVKYSDSGTFIYNTYDDNWRTDDYTCPVCGWTGNQKQMSGPNLFRELMDFECPKCEKMLLIVNYPTYRETLEAAAQGDEDAKYNLGVWSGEGEYWEDYKRNIEEYNQRLRHSWEKFEGPKMLFTSGGPTHDADDELVSPNDIQAGYGDRRP